VELSRNKILKFSVCRGIDVCEAVNLRVVIRGGLVSANYEGEVEDELIIVG